MIFCVLSGGNGTLLQADDESLYACMQQHCVRVPQHACICTTVMLCREQQENVGLISCPDDLVFKQGNSLTGSQHCSILFPRTA